MDTMNTVTVGLRNLDAIVLAKVLDYVSDDEALELRTVSRVWNLAFVMGQLDRYTVVITGADDLHAKIQNLLETSGHWQHFQLKNLDFQDNSTILDLMLACFVHLKPSISSIEFYNCRITMKQFIELMAIPDQLKELKIVNSFGLYSGGLEVIDAYESMKQFSENMSNLKRIDLQDNLDHENPIIAWLDRSTSLAELKSGMSKNSFDVSHLFGILSRNSSTLSVLSLNKISLDNSLIGNISLPLLEDLTLCDCILPDPITFSRFLAQQENVENLTFIKIKFKNLAFSKVEHLNQLRNVEFRQCDYEMSAIAPLRWAPKLSELKFVGEATTDQIEVQTFLHGHQLNRMRSLTLLLKEGTSSCLALIRKCFPNLETLDISYSGDIADDEVGHIWKMKKLKLLRLEGCSFANPTFFFPNSASLSNLRRLRHLDMDYTNVDDSTIPQILCLKRLQYLLLKATFITENGLANIIHHFKGQLRELGASGCTHCILSLESYYLYEDLLGEDCRFKCDIENDDNSTSGKEPELDDLDLDEFEALQKLDIYEKLVESDPGEEEDDLNQMYQ